MPQLKNWSFKLLPGKDIAVGGNIIGHSSYPDGMYITTSALNGLEKAGAAIMVSTSNNQYKMDLRSAQFKNTQPLLRAGALPVVPEQLRMYYDICAVLSKEYGEGAPQVADAAEIIRRNADVFGEYRLNVEKFMAELIDAKNAGCEKNRAAKEQAKAKLKNREIYLSLGGDYYFNFALMKDKDGTVHEMDEPTVETALSEISVFLFGWDSAEGFNTYDLRYFPQSGGRLEFYAWPAVPVYLHNSSDTELSIAIDGNGFTLNAGEERLMQ